MGDQKSERIEHPDLGAVVKLGKNRDFKKIKHGMQVKQLITRCKDVGGVPTIIILKKE